MRKRLDVDPDSNWAEALRTARAILRGSWDVSYSQLELDAQRLADLVLALNDWVRSGGFPPKVFQQKK